jgi:hypothetical protein
MPIYFGFLPGGSKATNLVTTTSQGSLEPAEPSKVKVLASPSVHSPFTRLVFSLIGHLVAVISHPVGFYLPFNASGAGNRPPSKSQHLPFKLPGLAFAIKPHQTLSDDTHGELTTKGFTHIQYGKHTVYMKEEGTREDYIWIDNNVPHLNPTAQVPNQYLNLTQFKGVLVFRNVTANICRTMHYFVSPHRAPKVSDALAGSKVVGYKGTWLYDGTTDIEMSVPINPTFEAASTVTTLGPTSIVGTMLSRFKDIFMHDSGLEFTSPVAFIHTEAFERSSRNTSFIQSSDTDRIVSSGVFFKFVPKLALPDPNLPCDIIGRYFLSCMGTSVVDQFENLDDVRSGLGGLRLTELSDSFSHLYKCIEIAIGAEAGCVPVFTGEYYEGCVVMGGVGALVHLGSKTYPFLPREQLQSDLTSSNMHALALEGISKILPTKREEIMLVKSMFELRKICIDSRTKPDEVNQIILFARDLRFSHRAWTVSPIHLKLSLNLMTDLTLLDDTYPISADSIFSKDPVLVALSVFGDSVPSWDIPSGTLQSISVDAPPNPPTSVNMKTTAAGQINDAAWVMQVRKTYLADAVEAFRRMANSGGYRTTTSVLAKKQGYYVYQRGRMIEFWNELKAAFRTINPNISNSAEDSKKRGIEKITDEPPSKKNKL